jgi:hypothetical protein
MKNKYQEMAGEFEGIFRQKMELGLFERTKDKLTSLPFASQVRIFHGGFAMWEQGLNRLGE